MDEIDTSAEEDEGGRWHPSDSASGQWRRTFAELVCTGSDEMTVTAEYAEDAGGRRAWIWSSASSRRVVVSKSPDATNLHALWFLSVSWCEAGDLGWPVGLLVCAYAAAMRDVC